MQLGQLQPELRCVRGGGHHLGLHLQRARQLALGGQAEGQGVHQGRCVAAQGQCLLGHRHRARLFLHRHHIGQVVERQHIGGLGLQHLAVEGLGAGLVTQGHRGVAQVLHKADVGRVGLAPVAGQLVGIGLLLAGHQRGVQALHGVARVLAAQGLAEGGSGVVPVFLAQFDVALDGMAHRLVRPLGLHRARHQQGLRRLALAQGQAGLGLLHLQRFGGDLGGLAHRRSHPGAVFGHRVGIGQAQLRQRRFGAQLGQLVEGADGLLGVVERQMGAAHAVEDLDVVREHRQCGLCCGQRRLDQAFGYQVVHQQQPGGELGGLGLDGLLQPLGGLLGLGATARTDLGQCQHRPGMLGLAHQHRLEARAGGGGLLLGQVEGGQAGQRRHEIRAADQRLLEVLARTGGVVALQRDAAPQLVGQGLAGQLGGQAVNRLEGAGEIVDADLGGDQCDVGSAALVAGGDGLQLGQGPGVLALAQL